jgi:hypothetical protein
LGGYGEGVSEGVVKVIDRLLQFVYKAGFAEGCLRAFCGYHLMKMNTR